MTTTISTTITIIKRMTKTITIIKRMTKTITIIKRMTTTITIIKRMTTTITIIKRMTTIQLVKTKLIKSPFESKHFNCLKLDSITTMKRLKVVQI